MQAGAADMLRRLAGISPASADAPKAAVVDASFGDLLARAESGLVSSDRPVTIDKEAGIELSPDQLSRLAKAADKAETAGAGVAAVLIDGMTLRLDVLGRRVLGMGDSVMTGIDAVVAAPGDASSSAVVLAPPPAGGMGPSLLKALASRDDRRD